MFIAAAVDRRFPARSLHDDGGDRRLVLVGEHGGDYQPGPEPARPEPPVAPQAQERWEPWKAAGHTLDAVGRLEQAIGGLGDADLDALGDADLCDVTLRLERAGNRLQGAGLLGGQPWPAAVRAADPDTAICTWTGPDRQTIRTHPPDP